MKKWFSCLGVLFLGLLVSACAQATPLPEQAPTKILPSATARASSPTPDLRPTRTPTVMPSPTQAVDYCVNCHTNKDQLTQNLKPTVVAPKESEGTG
jgi:hypothetical protein